MIALRPNGLFLALTLPTMLMGGTGIAAAAAPAKVCLEVVVSGTTRGPIRETVAARAIVVWSGATASSHGMRYSNWSNATESDVFCKRYTSTFGLNLWECRAVATPCRLR